MNFTFLAISSERKINFLNAHSWNRTQAAVSEIRCSTTWPPGFAQKTLLFCQPTFARVSQIRTMILFVLF